MKMEDITALIILIVLLSVTIFWKYLAYKRRYTEQLNNILEKLENKYENVMMDIYLNSLTILRKKIDEQEKQIQELKQQNNGN